MSDYKLVPVEPTPEMMKTFCVASKAVTTEEWEDPLYADQVADVLKNMPPAYRAMLAAAPAVQGEPVGYVSQDFLEGKWSLDHIAKSDEGQISRTIPVFAKPTQPSEQKPSTHWSHDNPGLADQYRAEAMAARRSVGFEQDADDVAPADIVAAIESLAQPAPDVAGLVEALKEIEQWVGRWCADNHPVVRFARKALDAHRKQGGEK